MKFPLMLLAKVPYKLFLPSISYREIFIWDQFLKNFTGEAKLDENFNKGNKKKYNFH